MFDWVQYIDVARSLRKAGGEAWHRSAVSRAYYAALCSARNWLRTNDPNFAPGRPGESHKEVWDRYDARPDRLSKRVAIEGRRLRQVRVEADYEDEVGKPDELSDLAIQRAESVVKLLGQIPKSG